MILSLIVAADEKNGIGKNNALIWHLPNDLRFFKQKTSGHCIVMGRKTYESLGKALPNRTNIVITTQPDYKAEGCIIVHSIEKAVETAEQGGEEECFIIGGGEIFNRAIHITDKIYFTRVHHVFDAEVFFPEFDWSDWQIQLEEPHQKDEKHAFDYTFYILKRKIVM